MKLAVIINGKNESGKDRLVKFLSEYLYNICNVYNISSVDNVKKAATLLGWDGNKDDKGRLFLSNLKDMSTEFYDGSFNYMKDILVNGGDGIYFFHIREPKEIQRFKIATNALTLLVKRNGEVANNHADMEVEDYHYDVVIENYGTIEEYEKKIKDFSDTYIIT